MMNSLDEVSEESYRSGLRSDSVACNFFNLQEPESSTGSNNFNKLSDITDIVNEKNFPKLRNLILYAQRRTDVLFDIASLGEKNASGVYVYNNYPIGLYGR